MAEHVDEFLKPRRDFDPGPFALDLYRLLCTVLADKTVAKIGMEARGVLALQSAYRNVETTRILVSSAVALRIMFDRDPKSFVKLPRPRHGLGFRTSGILTPGTEQPSQKSEDRKRDHWMASCQPHPAPANREHRAAENDEGPPLLHEDVDRNSGGQCENSSSKTFAHVCPPCRLSPPRLPPARCTRLFFRTKQAFAKPWIDCCLGIKLLAGHMIDTLARGGINIAFDVTVLT